MQERLLPEQPNASNQGRESVRARIAAAALSLLVPIKSSIRKVDVRKTPGNTSPPGSDTSDARNRSEALDLIARKIEESKEARARSRYRSKREIDAIARDVERRASITYAGVEITPGEEAARRRLTKEGRFFYTKALPALGVRVFLEPGSEHIPETHPEPSE